MNKLQEAAKNYRNTVEIMLVHLEDDLKKLGKSQDYIDGYKRAVRAMVKAYLSYNGLNIEDNH